MEKYWRGQASPNPLSSRESIRRSDQIHRLGSYHRNLQSGSIHRLGLYLPITESSPKAGSIKAEAITCTSITQESSATEASEASIRRDERRNDRVINRRSKTSSRIVQPYADRLKKHQEARHPQPLQGGVTRATSRPYRRTPIERKKTQGAYIYRLSYKQEHTC